MKKSRQLLIEKAAENIRNECLITEYGFHHIFEAAEKAGYRIIRYPIGNDSFLGFAIIKENEKIPSSHLLRIATPTNGGSSVINLS